MINSTSAPTLEADSESSESDQGLNKVASLPIMMSHERSHTTYHSRLMFDGDDEVFEDYRETSSVIGREPRARRISDVIDSIGCSPSSPISRSSSNFDFSEKTVTEESICTVRREEVKYINLQNPPKGRGLPSVTDSLMSETPPTTPTSDLGYCSAGLHTPPTTLVFKPKWYRYSASSDHSSPPKQDTMMDAQVMCAPTESQEKPIETIEPNSKLSSGVLSLEYPKAKMPVAMKSLEYNMGHPRMGHAIIFNHEEFLVDNTPPRVGSKLDAIRLSDTLTALGFTVTIYHDLDSEKIKMRINELASMDHGDCNCVLVAVLSHGMGTSYILSHDYPYPVDMLWSPFMPDRCDTLAGKPKIFLIQACRGDKLDGGVHLVSRTQTDSNSTQNYKIPAMADFLLAYSTAEGFYSWRNPLKGTWFVQSLCDVLDTEAYNHDLQTLLLMVAHRVALDHESYSDLYPWQHQQKQVPQTVSTLIRKVYFKRNP